MALLLFLSVNPSLTEELLGGPASLQFLYCSPPNIHELCWSDLQLLAPFLVDTHDNTEVC